jgi:hypothetical protein
MTIKMNSISSIQTGPNILLYPCQCRFCDWPGEEYDVDPKAELNHVLRSSCRASGKLTSRIVRYYTERVFPYQERSFYLFDALPSRCSSKKSKRNKWQGRKGRPRLGSCKTIDSLQPATSSE